MNIIRKLTKNISLLLFAALFVFSAAPAIAALIEDTVTINTVIDDFPDEFTPVPTLLMVTWTHTVPEFESGQLISARLVIQADDVDLHNVVTILWTGQSNVGNLDRMSYEDSIEKSNGYYGLELGPGNSAEPSHISTSIFNLDTDWIISGGIIGLTATIASQENQAEIETSTMSFEVVPEPATLALLGLGGLVLRKRKERK